MTPPLAFQCNQCNTLHTCGEEPENKTNDSMLASGKINSGEILGSYYSDNPVCGSHPCKGLNTSQKLLHIQYLH